MILKNKIRSPFVVTLFLAIQRKDRTGVGPETEQKSPLLSWQ